MNPYDMIYDLNDEVNKLTRQLEVTKASLSRWESVFGHLGTPDEVGNEWHSLSDRLEAAEKAVTEAYQRGYSTGQEEIEKERDELRAELKEVRYGVAVAHDTIKALRAKIEAMEKQEPAAFALYSGWSCKAVYLSEIEACEQRDRRQLTADLGGSLEAYRVVPLGALPCAQPAPSVPECPYPCGWRNLLKYASEDGAYLARSLNEDEP